LREALKGFDFKRALDVLEQQGALPPGNARGEKAKQFKVSGRNTKLYPIDPNKLGGNYEP
jgi:putative DNA primase/helicase